MPMFKVALHRPIRKSRNGMPEPNPFLAALPAPGRKSNWIVREWTFEAKDEAEVRQLLGEAYGAGVENVRDFSLRSIERVDVDAKPQALCSDCPPPGYPTDETRCDSCPRRTIDTGDGK